MSCSSCESQLPPPSHPAYTETLLAVHQLWKFRWMPGFLLVFLILSGSVMLSGCQQPASTGSAPAIRIATTSTAPATTAATTPAATTVLQSTPTSVQTLYNQTTQQAPVINDALTQPDNFGWDNYATKNTNCSFSAGTYHAKAESGFFSPCYAKATKFDNFVFQAQVTLIKGHSGGIVFRANSQTDQAYQFRISTDGTYILNKYFLDSAGKPQLQTLFSGSAAAIVTGLNHANLIGVVVQGSTISAFVNKQYVNSTNDTTYQSGQIGVYADSDAGSVEASFSKVQVWSL